MDAIKGCLAATHNRRMINLAVAPDHVQPESPDAIASDSPLSMVAGATVPFFIAWGGLDDDRLDQERTGLQMIAALTSTGCEVRSLVLPDCDYFGVHLNTQHGDDAWVWQVCMQGPTALVWCNGQARGIDRCDDRRLSSYPTFPPDRTMRCPYRVAGQSDERRVLSLRGA